MAQSAARAVFEKMSRQHESLERLWTGLDERLKGDGTNQKPVLRELQQLWQQLDAHFRFEEADGYFDEVVAKAPHLRNQADVLRGQHAELLAAVARLQETAGRISSGTAQFPALRRLFEETSRAFHEHEAAEGRLLEDAYCRDSVALD